VRLQELGPLEAALGVVFRQKDLLHLALAHSSFIHENPGVLAESNERLEFLGDAALGSAIARELYDRYPDWPEGELTLARSALVRGETLAAAADGLGLGEHLYMGRGEEAGGGRKRPANLAAAFEAVVGALLLDQGYEAARDFVLRVLSDELSDLGVSGAPGNPKSLLQEAVQARGQPSPSYEIVEVAGVEHARRFTAEVTVDGRVLGRGTGARKAQAESAAAAEALKALGE
jgi:ribonuclease-3